MEKKDIKSEPKENDFFPEELRGKKLKDAGWLSDECRELLEKYLRTENSELLFRAIKLDNYILQGVEGLSITTEFVDAHTIAWRTIHKWQELFYFTHNESDICVESKKLLRKIGNSLIPIKSGFYVKELEGYGELIIHKKPLKQGSKYHISYRSPFEFVHAWGLVRHELEKTKSKDKITGYKKAIGNLNEIFREDPSLKGYKLEMYESDADYLDDSRPIYTVASYFKIIHESNCKLCKEQGNPDIDLNPNTIYRRYKEAEEEIDKLSKFHS